MKVNIFNFIQLAALFLKVPTGGKLVRTKVSICNRFGEWRPELHHCVSLSLRRTVEQEILKLLNIDNIVSALH